MLTERIFLALALMLVLAPAPAVADEFAAVREQIKICDGCHGEGGASKDDAFPVLAGQEFHYLYVQLKDFKKGLRDNPVMRPVVAGLEKAEMLALAQFYSTQAWPNIGYRGDPEGVLRGETAANSGECTACHLGSYTGNSRIPRLAGQYPEYLEKTMLDMKSKARNNAAAMSSLMATYSTSEIADMAEYLGNM